MPRTEELGGIPRKQLNIFYVLDTSGSMDGVPIATLNRTMSETISSVKQLVEKTADALVKISVLLFNSSCQWVQPKGAERLEDFIWEDVKAGGMTEMGLALKELNSKMSRKGFIESDIGSYLPVIIIMTDGRPTDEPDEALEEIKKNKWFTKAVKIGFALGPCADVNLLEKIVQDSEAVIKTDSLETFARLFKKATVNSIVMQGQSRTTADVVTGKGIVNEIMGGDGDDPYGFSDDDDLFGLGDDSDVFEFGDDSEYGYD